MTELSPIRCGKCGATVELDLGAVVAGMLHCAHCNAALAAPPEMLFDVRIDAAQRSATPAILETLKAERGMPIQMVLDFLRAAPSIVWCGASAKEAGALREKLQTAGAQVSVLPCPGRHER